MSRSSDAGAARQGSGLGEGDDPEDPADGKDRCGAQGQAFEAGEPDQTPAQLAKAPASAQAAIRKIRPTAKTAAVRKAKRSKPVSRTQTPAQLATPSAPSHPAPAAKAPAPAQTAPARKPNGVGQASTKLGTPAIAT